MQILGVIFNLWRLICYFLDQYSRISCQEYQITRLKSIIPNIETSLVILSHELKSDAYYYSLCNIFFVFLYWSLNVHRVVFPQDLVRRGVCRGWEFVAGQDEEQMILLKKVPKKILRLSGTLRDDLPPNQPNLEQWGEWGCQENNLK